MGGAGWTQPAARRNLGEGQAGDFLLAAGVGPRCPATVLTRITSLAQSLCAFARAMSSSQSRAKVERNAGIEPASSAWKA